MSPADLPAVAPLAIACAVVTGRAWPSYLGPARPAPTAPALPSGPDTEAASSSLRSGSFRARAFGKGVRYAHLDAAPFGPMPPIPLRCASARPERLRFYLQGRPRPGPLRRASSRSVLATLRAARLQARRIHPSRPRSAPRKKAVSSGTSPPETAFLRSASRAVFATLTSVRPTHPRPRRGQASRQVSFFRYAPERDLSRCLLAGGRSVPAFHRASRSSRQAPP